MRPPGMKWWVSPLSRNNRGISGRTATNLGLRSHRHTGPEADGVVGVILRPNGGLHQRELPRSAGVTIMCGKQPPRPPPEAIPGSKSTNHPSTWYTRASNRRRLEQASMMRVEKIPPLRGLLFEREHENTNTCRLKTTAKKPTNKYPKLTDCCRQSWYM